MMRPRLQQFEARFGRVGMVVEPGTYDPGVRSTPWSGSQSGPGPILDRAQVRSSTITGMTRKVLDS